VVIADDEIQSEPTGMPGCSQIANATINGNNESQSLLMGILDAFHGEAIALPIAVGEVVIEFGAPLGEEVVEQRYPQGSVYIIIAIKKNAFAMS
jgi:hypothetical protein